MAERPIPGMWFEELTPGLVIHHALRRTVTESDNVMFTTLRRVYPTRHESRRTATGRHLLPD